MKEWIRKVRFRKLGDLLAVLRRKLPPPNVVETLPNPGLHRTTNPA
jgi:hypothetical protein